MNEQPIARGAQTNKATKPISIRDVAQIYGERYPHVARCISSSVQHHNVRDIDFLLKVKELELAKLHHLDIDIFLAERYETETAKPLEESILKHPLCTEDREELDRLYSRTRDNLNAFEAHQTYLIESIGLIKVVPPTSLGR